MPRVPEGLAVQEIVKGHTSILGVIAHRHARAQANDPARGWIRVGVRPGRVVMDVLADLRGEGGKHACPTVVTLFAWMVTPPRAGVWGGHGKWRCDISLHPLDGIGDNTAETSPLPQTCSSWLCGVTHSE
jgi:hypothetical protein